MLWDQAAHHVLPGIDGHHAALRYIEPGRDLYTMLLTPEKGLVGLSLAVLLGGAAVLLLLTRGPAAYLVSGDACLLTGSFSAQGVYPTNASEDPRYAGEAAFGSWSGTASHAGSFTSDVFRAPCLLNFCVSGYPRQQGISLYLEDAENKRRLALKVLEDPRETWKRLQWTLPADWRFRPVRLVADDQSHAPGWWIGLTLPREGSAEAALPQLGRAAAYAAAMGTEGALFLLPGLVLAMLLRHRFALDGLRFTAVAITGAAAVGYLCFWIYFATVNGGKIASWVLLGASVLATPLLVKRGWKRSPGVWRECASTFGLVLLTGWFYLGIGYFYSAGGSPGLQAANRFTMKQLPPDHLLPWMLAHHIYHEVPLRPYLLDVWKSSDRPPLQAGIALAQCQLWKVFDEETHYYLLAIFLQSLWAGALWIFLRFAAVPPRGILMVLSLCIFSGFFFFHSFYVWPKLLAATLFLTGLTFSRFNRPGYQGTKFDAVHSGTAITLGLLSHTGVLLAAPGVAWVLYRSRALPSRRTAAWGTAAVVLLCLPWVWYQRWYDPPGDLLLKAHFAGSMDQEHSFGQLVRDAYGKLSPQEWARNKLENVRVLFVPYNFRPIFTDDPLQRYDAFTRGNFYSMFQALGLLNLGLLVRLRMRWIGREATARADIRLADRCVAAALVSTGMWCLVMFSPGSTIIHQGSLATMLLLFLALGIYLSSLAPRLAWVAAGIQMATLPIFVLGKLLFGNLRGTLMEGAVDSGFATVALLSMAGMLIWAEFVKTAPPALAAKSGT
jgi:hypothetical protein